MTTHCYKDCHLNSTLHGGDGDSRFHGRNSRICDAILRMGTDAVDLKLHAWRRNQYAAREVTVGARCLSLYDPPVVIATIRNLVYKQNRQEI